MHRLVADPLLSFRIPLSIRRSVLFTAAMLTPTAVSGQVPPPLEILQERADEARVGPPHLLGEALQALADGYAYQGRHADAVSAGTEALHLFLALNDSAALAAAHTEVGLAHWNLVRYDSAVAHFTRAADLWLLLDDRASLGRAYNNLGAAHYQWGNYELALSWFLQALQVRRETGNEAGAALAQANVGLTYRDWGQLERARDAYEDAILISDRIGYTFGQAYARLNLAELHLAEGELDRAEELFEASLAYYETEVDPIYPPEALGGRILNFLGLAQIRIQRGDAAGAIASLTETLGLALEAESPRYEARTRLDLGRAHRAAGDLERAVEQLRAALQAAQEREQRPIAIEILAALAEVEELRGQPASALEHLKAHSALRDSVFDQSTAQRIAAMEAQAEIDRQQRENVRLREEQRVQDALIQRQRTTALLIGGLLVSTALLVVVLVHFNRRGREREATLARVNDSLEKVNQELTRAALEVQTLQGLIPICSSCKRVRDDAGYWGSVESYISERSAALFSHSICTECGPVLYGEDWPVLASEDPEG